MCGEGGSSKVIMVGAEHLQLLVSAWWCCCVDSEKSDTYLHISIHVNV